MHDPYTVAFEIKYPWKRYSKFWPKGERNTFITIWHKDPERKGDDDSCGWFKRAYHGNSAVLEKIRKRFAYDWDSTFKSESGHLYYTGYFYPENGMPNLSVTAIALNLFRVAALEFFNEDWEKVDRFMSRNLWSLLHFAENPHDSLSDSITRKFELGCSEEYTKERRDARIGSMASIIYGYILRREQRWYRHPRWHVHHWRIVVHPLRDVWNWLFLRCAKCGRGFKWKESRIGNWAGTAVWHDRCQGETCCKPQAEQCSS